MLTCMLLVFLPAMCVPLTDAASVPNIFFILAGTSSASSVLHLL